MRTADAFEMARMVTTRLDNNLRTPTPQKCQMQLIEVDIQS
jgi:hypothetical protein